LERNFAAFIAYYLCIEITMTDANGAPPEEATRNASAGSFSELKDISWFRQFYWATWKNYLLLIRRPIMFVTLLLSSVISVVIGWSVGRDPDEEDVIYAPLTECGTIDNEWLENSNLSYTDQYKVQSSLNDAWRYGFPVTLMALGPMVNAVIVFIFVQTEFSSQLVGVLRALGLRDSVYWTSWYVPLAVISFFNALLGAITFAALPGHVYESVYFGGAFASLFFLQLALVSASFFMAALTGTSRNVCANFVILIMLVATFIPQIFGNLRGMFWQNTSTYERSYNGTTGENYECNIPVLNEYQGTWYKTDAERALVQNDEFFVGCYIAASWGVKVWRGNSVTGLIFMFTIPYFHFLTIWGNFVGYTAMPDRVFTAAEASLSTEALALKALPDPPNPDWGLVSEMAPQQSTFVTEYFYDYDNWNKNPCPLPNTTGANFCEYLNYCEYAEDPGAVVDSPSTNAMYGWLFALSMFYLLAAAYLAQVFPKGNGRPAKFYFFLLPTYWFGTKSNPEGGHGSGVVVENVKKSFGSFEALKGISFKMAQGEVTALLGKSYGETRCIRVCIDSHSEW
jgi:ABC-type multidrug transport system fused ATPase/permease subunit